MNNSHPALADFLAAAETLLRNKVIVASQGDARFAGLMVASALGMARREIALGKQLESANLDLLELAPQPSPFPDMAAALTQLIRGGLMDGQDELFRRLQVDAITRTAVTRPQVVSEHELRLAGLHELVAP